MCLEELSCTVCLDIQVANAELLHIVTKVHMHAMTMETIRNP